MYPALVCPFHSPFSRENAQFLEALRVSGGTYHLGLVENSVLSSSPVFVPSPQPRSLGFRTCERALNVCLN